MARSEIIDFVFWAIVLILVVALFGLYRGNNWRIFLRWVTFIGLALDATGALILGLSEFRWIQKHMWIDLMSAQQQLSEKQPSGQDMNHETCLEPDDSGFEKIEQITRDRRSLSLGHEPEEQVDVEEFRFWPNGDIYAYGTNSNQVTLGSPELVRRWVREKAADLTRKKVLPYAIILLFLGFLLQLISYGFQNL